MCSGISVGFNATEYAVSEADGTITIEIIKYGLTTRAINVEFSTQDDTAIGMALFMC